MEIGQQLHIGVHSDTQVNAELATTRILSAKFYEGDPQILKVEPECLF